MEFHSNYYSEDMYSAFRAAERSEREAGAFLFTVGINLKDTTELDEVSSNPLSHYQLLVNTEEQLQRFTDRFSDLVHKCKLMHD